MISRRNFLQLAGLAAGSLVAGCAPSAMRNSARSSSRPNIIWILADDLGYGDLGCYGNYKVKTPNLDKLAARGVKLTDFYVTTPVCSPSRGALLTGRYPQRNGLTNVIEVNDRTTHLPLRETLISDLMQQNGYKTACIGKWHIGEPKPAQPNARGFDYFFGSPLGGIDFFTHQWMDGSHILYENHTPVHREGEYITDILGEKAAKFVDKNADDPFFMYLSFFAVHTAMGPESANKVIQAPKRWEEYYRKQGLTAEKDIQFAGCLSAMDEAIGKVVDTLEKHNLKDETFIFFTSDNGPDPRESGTAFPCSGTKHQMWEGGVREPAIACWPGKIPAAKIRTNPAITLDLFPTTLHVAGIQKPRDLYLDGQNILPQLISDKPAPQRDLYFSYIRKSHGDTKEKAVRRGKWVWVNGELYDLTVDIGQQKNIADEYPHIAAQLETAWNQWIDQFPLEKQRWAGESPRIHEWKPLRPWGINSVDLGK